MTQKQAETNRKETQNPPVAANSLISCNSSKDKYTQQLTEGTDTNPIEHDQKGLQIKGETSNNRNKPVP